MTKDAIQLVDTHCHIQFPDYQLDKEKVIADAKQTGVNRLICVGCSLEDSRLGIELANTNNHRNVWAAIGLHPHDAKDYFDREDLLKEFADLATKPKVVAIGECGLDYYYNHSPREQQIKLLKFQIELATEYNLPLIFHVRDAFDDFWHIFSEYPNLKGVLHSFTDSKANMEKGLERGLYIGVNGIVTFTKDPEQLAMYKAIPLNRLVLETDAPFLTPTPYRGSINESKYVKVVAAFMAELRGETLLQLATSSTHNAQRLFNLI